jgi:hypothetical protein
VSSTANVTNTVVYNSNLMFYSYSETVAGPPSYRFGRSVDARGLDFVRSDQAFASGRLWSLDIVAFCNRPANGFRHSVLHANMDVSIVEARAVIARYGAAAGGRRYWDDVVSGHDDIVVQSTGRGRDSGVASGFDRDIDAGDGNDVITDGFGTDVPVGGGGNDMLRAGTGTNSIVINPADVFAGDLDIVEFFTASATNDLQLPVAWQGKVAVWDDGTATTLAFNTPGGADYVQLAGASAAYVNARTYYA